MRFHTFAFGLPVIASIVSAWEFTGWDLQLYQGDLLIYRSGNGLTNNLCVDIIQNDNRMSSFKWYRGTNIFCSFKLFDNHHCEGDVLASSTGNWNVPAISHQNDNRASSLWVDCI